MAKSAPKMLIPTILSGFRSGFAGDSLPILGNPGKILLVKQSERLGNIVLMNAGIDALSKVFPKAGIDLLLPAAYADVLSANAAINKTIPIEKKKYISRPWLLLKVINLLRKQGYDLAIDCSDVNSHSSTGADYTLMAGARLTAGWKMGGRRIFDIEIERYNDSPHAMEMYLRLFSGIFKRKFEGSPYFDDNKRASSGESQKIGINCGGRGSKRWPLDNLLEIGAGLANEGYLVELILGPDENAIRSRVEDSLPEGCQLLPIMSLLKLMERMRSYDLFISSDTGPMHLAWSLKIPVIAIFLDSELDKFKPLSPGSEAIDAQKGVTPSTVLKSALRILKAGRVPA